MASYSAGHQHYLAGIPYTNQPTYSQSKLSAVHTSVFDVIPKCYQPGKWQLIVDVSYAKGHSVNNGILRSLCELHYITIDDAIQKIVKLSQGSILAKN